MQPPRDDPAHQLVLDELRRLAVETYGEERAAEGSLQAALALAATAVWRVSQEPLAPADDQP